MTKAVTAGQPAATAGAAAIYRKLFDSFNPDKHGRPRRPADRTGRTAHAT